MDTYEGTVESIIFRNADNGYTVLELSIKEDELITVVGGFAQVLEGEKLRVSGHWTQHRDYGDQLKLESYESLDPETLSGIARLLGSGWIKGLGPSTATAIAARFGKNALHVIEHEPERLSVIRGISKAKALDFSSQYKTHRGVKDVLAALGGVGITAKDALKLHALYGERALEFLSENPYRVIDDIDGFGFAAADKIAAGLGFDAESPLRLTAGLKHMLLWSQNEGHTHLPHERLIKATCDALGVLEGPVERVLDELLLSRALIAKDMGYEGVFLPWMFIHEGDSARTLLDLQSELPEPPPIDVSFELSRLEISEQLQLAPMQREAVSLSLKNGVTIITGGPGTGKTTILLLVIKLMQKIGLKTTLAAPTGRAAKRMTETTGYAASTLHRLLECNRDREFGRNRNNPLHLDVLIVDEASMLDAQLLYRLLDALLPGTRVIFCGDVDQLPSVGPGNVLHDLIESECFPVVRLDEVFRQSGRSMIVHNAHRINAGLEPELVPGSDFTFEPYEHQDMALERLVKLALAARRKGYDIVRDVQVLAPMKRGMLGVWNCNVVLQRELNPPAPDKPERAYGSLTLRLGDKVMQTINNYEQEWARETDYGVEQGAGVFNGDMGQIAAILEDGFEVLFDDDRRAIYSLKQIEELDLAYCVSIHKSQGSEFKIVLLPLCDCPYPLLTRNLLYTAVTRARQSCVVLGRWNTVLRMAAHEDTRKRYSALRRFLTELSLISNS